MLPDSPRWHEISPSQFAHERDGLNALRDILPDRAPFQAWTNFEFRDSQGKWHEIDALVLGERRLHLIELKHYRGSIAGNSYVWQRGRTSEDNPLLRTRSNAQRLSSLIKTRLRELAPALVGEVPWIQECVFLHADDFRCLMPAADRTDLFGPDGQTGMTNLPSLADRLLEPADGRPNKLIQNDDLIVGLFEKIGFGVRREREVGSWRLLDQSAEGDGWQDWSAEHKLMHSKQARIRFFVTSPSAPEAERVKVRALVKREYEVTRRLNHDGVTRPEDLVDDELGIGLVYPRTDDEQRLDLWLADHGAALSIDDRLRLVRQLAETVKYVHQRHLVHRALTPAAITIAGPAEDPTLNVGDWQFAGATDASDQNLSRGTATRLFAGAEEAGAHMAANDPAGAFLAPEARWVSDADRVRLDIFAVGAIAYLIFANQPPAADAADLRLRVQRENGLNLAADVPELAAGLRQLVMDATNPVVTDRLADADAFLAGLDAAEDTATTTNEPDDDPLNAPIGTVVGGRYRIKRRLGSGSTAVGLLVLDTQDEDAPYVLKVALSDRANQRLADEAVVLESVNRIKNQRIVRLIQGPIQVGSRQALLLESAGDQTLADVLKSRRRVSLDLLDRWGTDLLEAAVALDKAGVDHRDLKPANLGIRETRGNRTKHLVLFDFSLSRAGASAIEAGTPPYLDPFLGPPHRPTFDSAAERYAAAVTLFEMATGDARGPRFGDGASDPGILSVEASPDLAAFDPSIADALLSFFQRAFLRSAHDRFHTAGEMLTAWRAIFDVQATTVPETAIPSSEVTAETPLGVSGLTARALSALEPLRLETVGDLARVDPGRLTRLSGVAEVTRKEIREKAKQWRQAFAATARVEAVSTQGRGPFTDVVASAERLCELAASPRAQLRRDAARVVFGLDGEVDAFGTLAQLAEASGKGGSPQMSVVLAQIQKAWADNDEARSMLDAVTRNAVTAIDDLGQVASVADVVGYLVDPAAGDRQRRVAAGLLRAALDRADDVAQGADEPAPVLRRRFKGSMLLATDNRVLEAGASLGAAADALVAEASRAGEALVPPARALERLVAKWPMVEDDDKGLARPADRKLTRLAARLSAHAAVSARGELHGRDLPPATALNLAVTGLAQGQTLTVDDLLAWVRARFPDLARLPLRPRLDQLVVDAGLGLTWDGKQYVVPTDSAYTTGIHSSTMLTLGPIGPALSARRQGSAADAALRSSRDANSFLALGLPKARRLSQAIHELEDRYGAEQLDVTDVVITALRERAAAVSIPWDTVTAADAAAHDSRDWLGLNQLVRQCAPAIEQRLTDAATTAVKEPLLLTDAAPLARYGLMPLLARLADITTAHARAIWLLLPLGNSTGPALDGSDLHLSHGGQFVTLDEPWFTTRAMEGNRA